MQIEDAFSEFFEKVYSFRLIQLSLQNFAKHLIKVSALN